MRTSSYQHISTIEVRYAETDQMGIVHHSVYAVWFEQARTEFFRTSGASYAEMEKEGFSSPVLELQVQYKNPTHYGEFVTIKTKLVQEDRIRFRFYYEAYVDERLCTTGSSLHCFLKNGRPTKDLPQKIDQLFPSDK